MLVLVSGATLDDLREGGDLPSVRQLANEGGVALLHNRTWGTFNENAAYLSVGASERMAAPASGDLSGGALRRFQPNVADRAAKVGALGRSLAGRAVVLEDHHPPLGSLVTLDARVSPATANPDVQIIIAGSKADCEAIMRQLLGDKRTDPPATIVASPETPEIVDGAPYRRLGFLVWGGSGISPGSLLISPTTRTPGLIANVDIAPTVAAFAPRRIPGAAGAVITTLPNPPGRAWEVLADLDRQTIGAARATTPVLAGYGLFAGVSCLLAVGALRIRSPKLVGAARFALLIAASTLLALLPTGIVAPRTSLIYGAVLAGIAVAVAATAQVIAKPLRADPLRLVLYALVATITADSFFHAHLVERSVLSGATLTGIRFYGMGNEWFGLYVGAAIACAAPWWIGVLVVCADGLPYFGADAGGTLAASTAFVLLALCRDGKVNVKRVAGSFGAGIAVTLLFALLDRLQPGSARSHVGAAVAAGQSPSGLHALADIALRKVTMNASLLLSPWTLLTLAGMALMLYWIRRAPASSRTPEWAGGNLAVLPVAVTGAVVSLLFNDGGVAAGILFLVPVLVRWLDAALAGKVEPE